jgi:hypothetical protein
MLCISIAPLTILAVGLLIASKDPPDIRHTDRPEEITSSYAESLTGPGQ